MARYAPHCFEHMDVRLECNWPQECFSAEPRPRRAKHAGGGWVRLEGLVFEGYVLFDDANNACRAIDIHSILFSTKVCQTPFREPGRREMNNFQCQLCSTKTRL